MITFYRKKINLIHIEILHSAYSGTEKYDGVKW